MLSLNFSRFFFNRLGCLFNCETLSVVVLDGGFDGGSG